MPTAALYRALVSAGASEKEALEAAHEMEKGFKTKAEEFVTKPYLKDELELLGSRLCDTLTWRILLIVVMIVGIFSGLVITAVSFMLHSE